MKITKLCPNNSACTLVAVLMLTLIFFGSTAVQAQDLKWAKGVVGTGPYSDWGSSIAVDTEGNTYVTGGFNGTATFGPGEANETVLNSAGQADLFVAKYDSNGALIWVKRAGGTNGEGGSSIAVDGLGNSYVTGGFSGTVTFGLGEANQTILTSAGYNDIFVAKYNTNGALLWAKRAGGAADDDWGSGIAVDGAGKVYVTGAFRVTATFGAGEAHQTTLTSAGYNDIFVAKYDSNAALIWVKRAGGTDVDEGNSIALDGSGNSYVTGSFRNKATFGPG